MIRFSKIGSLVTLAGIGALSLGGCAANVDSTPADEKIASAQEAATAYEVERDYFSDATFHTQVGYSDLPCTGGIRRTGITTTHFFFESKFPCLGGLASAHCVECNGPGGTDCAFVTCPVDGGPYGQ
jgi:hypothetical protein